ncbi:hypothetical protein Tco_0294504, partial [Tanacetum coccineum]
MTAKLGPEAQVIVWSKPGGLVYLLYVIKSPQSSMILPADHVLRAVINARLCCCWFASGVIYFICIAAVDYVSGIHVASSDYWLASFFARLFKMTNFAVKHSIMTPEMVEHFCNDYYIPDEVHPVAPGRDKTITQFPEGKVGVYTRPNGTSGCYFSRVTPAASGSSSAAAPEVSAPAEVEPENVVP